MTGHGGKRPGAGRKKKNRSGQEYFQDAEAYLSAVVRGETEPDSVRVTAAKALIAYQKAKQRAPIQSPTPSKLREKTERDIEKSNVAKFQAKAAEILKKHGRIKS